MTRSDSSSKIEGPADAATRRGTYLRTRDVLDRARRSHRRLERRLNAMAGERDDERWSLLLRHLAARERDLADALHRYEEESPLELEERWMQYLPEVGHVDPATEQGAGAERPTLSEVVAEVVGVSRHLQQLYTRIAEQAATPSMRELFGRLATTEEHEARALALALQQGDPYADPAPGDR